MTVKFPGIAQKNKHKIEEKAKENHPLMKKGQIWEINTRFVLHNSFVLVKTEMPDHYLALRWEHTL